MLQLAAEQDIYAKNIAPNIELWLEGIKDLLKLAFYSAGIKKS